MSNRRNFHKLADAQELYFELKLGKPKRRKPVEKTTVTLYGATVARRNKEAFKHAQRMPCNSYRFPVLLAVSMGLIS